MYWTVRHDLLFSFSPKEREEINFYVFLATAVIACIACYEFKRSHELTANEFLLFISNRWGAKEIIKARQILHELFVKSYRDKRGNAKCEYNRAICDVSELVLQMSRTSGMQGESFIYLLNLLDYLETLSYFFSRGDLEIADIRNICGNNAIFFFESFKLFIEQRQKHDKKYYSNFTYLYYELKKMQIKNS